MILSTATPTKASSLDKQDWSKPVIISNTSEGFCWYNGIWDEVRKSTLQTDGTFRLYAACNAPPLQYIPITLSPGKTAPADWQPRYPSQPVDDGNTSYANQG